MTPTEARAVLDRAVRNPLSSIRCYLGARNNYLDSGSDEAYEATCSSAQYLTVAEHDAVMALSP